MTVFHTYVFSDVLTCRVTYKCSTCTSTMGIDSVVSLVSFRGVEFVGEYGEGPRRKGTLSMIALRILVSYQNRDFQYRLFFVSKGVSFL